MFQHKTVLLEETVNALDVHDNGIYVDATFGRGGHTKLLLSKGKNLKVFSFDRDQAAIDSGQELIKSTNENTSNHLDLIKDNFENIKTDLNKRGITEIDGILYDLGVSSPQFDDPNRGFSYRYDSRLDMRMDQSQSLDAYKVINEWDYGSLVKTFFRYGGEKFSKRIARNIVNQRQRKPIATTFELSDIIKESIPAAARRTGGNPSKRVFQAVRIAVNDELGSLEQSLEAAIALLAVGGRISVITFQSLEDRIVKQMFKEYSEIDVPEGLPIIPPEMQPKLKMINKKPIVPSEEELEENHRSHSARLRVAKKLRK